ncbi:MAG: sulfurtransferase complex subunit TusB [Methyloglobulus sp.]|nr:sulfurtransferase complex subunit TusB [Methyloglobulus sp.]
MLHLIFQSPVEPAILDRMATDDVAVFLENAVLSALQKGQLADAISQKLNSNRLYVLSEDMAVRGIDITELVLGLEVIDYPGLVDLSVENRLIQSWR